MSNKSYGLDKERAVKKLLEKKGYQAHRCRGSFGCFDIIAHNNLHWLLVQVKSTKQKYSSYNKDIENIKNIIVPESTIKQLWVYWSPCKDRNKRGWEIQDIE